MGIWPFDTEIYFKKQRDEEPSLFQVKIRWVLSETKAIMSSPLCHWMELIVIVFYRNMRSLTRAITRSDEVSDFERTDRQRS